MAKRKPPKRFVRLLRSLAEGEGVDVCCLGVGKKLSYYVFKEIGSTIGGRAFAMHRLGLGSVYHVLVGHVEQCSCECMGFLAHGTCKHVLGLMRSSRASCTTPTGACAPLR